MLTRSAVGIPVLQGGEDVKGGLEVQSSDHSRRMRHRLPIILIRTLLSQRTYSPVHPRACGVRIFKRDSLSSLFGASPRLRGSAYDLNAMRR